ncbi:SRPBCC family protein [Haloarchaeobius sp. HRN-SO-5]|uniref:SRPBCC family protein n=1 Tax=Haloarchaeobius sp. HRN-SO-5 TaxID=3446118 RepID=UPI003EBCE842
MPVYSRETFVRAPLSTVWDFHSHISGLEALTPDFANLRVEAVRGPDGEPDPAVLAAGTQISMSMRPFGVGPRQRWTSVITDRTEDERAATFRDEMRDGPFPHWDHTHSFYARDDGTLVSDRVEYRLPLGPLGDLVGPLAWFGLEPMFRYRHRRTRELLEP